MSEGVLIVGGGPVGLTLAWRLTRLGLPATVFEMEPEIPDQLRASTFHPPTLDMLEEDGITADLLAEGRVTPTWQIRVHETGARAEFDLGVLSGLTGHPYRLQCHQRILCAAMARRLRAADAPPRWGAAVVRAGADDDGAWVETEDGERVVGRFVVGCDGARSVVRAAIGAEFEGATYPETTVLATTRFRFEDVFEGLSGVNYIWKEGGTFSLLRLPDLWRCSFTARPGEEGEAAAEDAALRRHLEEVLPERAAEVEIIDRRPYRVHARLASRWRRGRLLLAGDAAHLNSPKGGMGLNAGVHDAFELAETLAAVYAGADVALLDRYERRRKPVVAEEIIGQADANRRRMAMTDSSARAAELARLQRIAADPDQARAFLARSSMIEGLDHARAAV